MTFPISKFKTGLLLALGIIAAACSQATSTQTYTGSGNTSATATQSTDSSADNSASTDGNQSSSTEPSSSIITVSPTAPGFTRISETEPVELSSIESIDADYPKLIELNGKQAIIHAPQISSWTDFEILEGIAAVESVPQEGEETRYGVVEFTASAIPDLGTRTVEISDVNVTAITEGDNDLSGEAAQLFEEAFPEAKTIPLDLALSHLAESVEPISTPGVTSEPPTIFVAKESAALMLLHGEPLLTPIENLDIQFAANTNWSLFFDDASELWYLRNDDTWLQADDYSGPWSWAGSLPTQLSQLPGDGNWTSVRQAAQAWQGAPVFSAPQIFVATTPAELILLVGEANLVEIVDGLSYVNNTDSQIFEYEGSWYYLVSGRWFSTDSLSSESVWLSQTDLPAVFASIPDDHPMGNVLASVPGTMAAKIAYLETQIPEKTTLPLDATLPELVIYNGDPEFVQIAGTNLYRAANTSSDVIQSGDMFYLCFEATWFEANSALGPWFVTADIPDEIDRIPPSDPAYKVTYVNVASTTPTTVTYAATSGYSMNVYISYGVPVYGTGWFYPPYYYYYGGYPYYHRYPVSYGHGSYYNSRTGSYGSVTRAYGPYGGWGYASAVNPSTGTYGRAEAVWDYDEWYAVGEAYNPDSGKYFGTERYYDADNGEWETDSTFETNRGEVDISRNFNDEYGEASIRTSNGGEGNYTRHASDGGWDTSGEFTTGDGRTIESSGRFEDGRGTVDFAGSGGGTGTVNRDGSAGNATRQGNFTGADGGTVDTVTRRNGGDSTTGFETSDGARGVTSRDGALGERSSIVETGSGDVYASRDGNVYKQGDNGWEQVENGGRSAGSERTAASRNTDTSSASNRASASDRTSTADRTRQTSGFNQNSTFGTGQSRSQPESIVNRNQNLNRQQQSRSYGMNRSRQYQSQYGGRGNARGRRR